MRYKIGKTLVNSVRKGAPKYEHEEWMSWEDMHILSNLMHANQSHGTIVLVNSDVDYVCIKIIK